MLIGCGLRRAELLALPVDAIQLREEHWVIADLLGKAGHIRTVPIPKWVKEAVDAWKEPSGITEAALFRSINKTGRVWGNGMTPKVLWEVVRKAASRAGIEKLAPHDLRRYAESRIMPNRWLDLPFGGWFRSSRTRAIRHDREGYRFFRKVSNSSSGLYRAPLIAIGVVLLRASSFIARSASK